jgi:hypothetical protein
MAPGCQLQEAETSVSRRFFAQLSGTRCACLCPNATAFRYQCLCRQRVAQKSIIRSHCLPTSVRSWRFGRGLIVVLGAFALITVLEGSNLSARSGIQPPAETVNRTLKGDRLPSSHARPPAAHPRERASDAKLPYGCEPLISPLVSRELARIAGRCLS